MTTELPTQTDGGALSYQTAPADEEQFDDKHPWSIPTYA